MNTRSFAEISALEFWSSIWSRRELVGPKKPVSDYRLVAGLLFSRWNSSTTRILCCRQNEPPQIEICWHHDFSRPTETVILVTPEAVDKLVEERALNETDQSHLYCRRFVLNRAGKQLVVTKWVSNEIDFRDYMAAGAVYETTTGQMRW